MSHSSPDEPVSKWLKRAKEGDRDAVKLLWNYYANSILSVARQRLPAKHRLVEDEEDVLASVFESLWKGAQNGQFAEYANRNQLWGLLFRITQQKTANIIRRESTKKRGGEHEREEPQPDTADNRQQTPEAIIEMRETYERLMALLESDELRNVAALKLQGCLDQEIAEQIGTSLRTVERRLNAIRIAWRGLLGNSDVEPGAENA